MILFQFYYNSVFSSGNNNNYYYNYIFFSKPIKFNPFTPYTKGRGQNETMIYRDNFQSKYLKK